MEADNMTVLQIARLSEWLKEKGNSSDDIIDCINYIANYNPKEKSQTTESQSEKSNS